MIKFSVSDLKDVPFKRNEGYSVFDNVLIGWSGDDERILEVLKALPQIHKAGLA